MAKILYDGDYSVATPSGPPEFEVPFAVDPKPYLYKQPYWQFLNDFVEPALGETGPAGGGYVGGSAGTIKSIGGGIIEFSRAYALVPNSRSEFESFVYDYHLGVFTFGVPDTCLQGNPLCVHSRIQFDYFRTSDPDGIDLPRAPQILSTCAGTFILGAFPTGATPSGTEVLAQDATFKCWKPGIYERSMRFIKWINSTELLSG